MPRRLLFLCLVFCAAPGVHAQSADSVQLIHAAAIQDRVSIPVHEAARSMYGGVLADRGAYTVLALRRTADGEAEVHAEWDDVMMIQEGAATLLSGGEVAGARESAPGELRGGRITGGTRRALAPGDVVMVPAGVPHQMLVAEGESIVYLVVKVQRRPPAP
jgi:mannose-6-phosphate isomerase-like protein (cupin superfamily)